MLRKSILSLFVVGLVAVSTLLVGAPPADAAFWDDPEWWGYDAAQAAEDGCDNVRDLPVVETIFGTTEGNLAFGTAGTLLRGGTLAPAVTGTGAAAATTAGATGAAAGSTAIATVGAGALWVLYFGGVACTAGIDVGRAIFGDRRVVPPMENGAVTIEDPVPCESFSPAGLVVGARPGDYCLGLVPNATPPEGAYLQPLRYYDTECIDGGGRCTPGFGAGSVLPSTDPFAPLAGGYGVSEAGSLTVDFPASSRPYNGTDGGAAWVIPCASPEVMCGLTPWTRNSLSPTIDMDPWTRAPGVGIRVNNSFVGGAVYEPARQQRFAMRVRAFARCKNPSTGVENEKENVSDVFGMHQADDVEMPLPPACDPGFAPIRVWVGRQVAEYGGVEPAEWIGDPRTEPAVDYTMPDDVKNNSDTIQCFLVGVTNCPIWEASPEDPNVRVGGPNGVQVPRTSPRVGTAVQELIEEAPWPESEPEPNPTTTVVPNPTTTVPTTTTTTPDDPCRGGAPSTSGCTPVDPPEDPPEGGDGECFPSGWGWLNPIEWVLKPVKCALLWAFWDQDTADEIAGLGEDHGWTTLINESNVSTDPAAGPCIDMDVAEICSSAVLEVEAPEPVQLLVAVAVSFFALFECIGLFARVTQG